MTSSAHEPVSTVFPEYDRPERERGSRLLLVESVFGSVPPGVHGNFVSAFAIRLGASTFQIGIMSAVTEVLSAAALIAAAMAVKLMGGRKRMMVTSAALGALPWLLLASALLLPEHLRIWATIILSAFAAALLGLVEPAWSSLMADLVPLHRRAGIWACADRWSC